MGLDSGTRGYNPRCRDTVALPPPSSLEWAKARVEREKADIWLNPLARRRGRRDPGRGWALQAFIKTPAPLPHPSSPPAPVPGPAQFFVPHPLPEFFSGGKGEGKPGRGKGKGKGKDKDKGKDKGKGTSKYLFPGPGRKLVSVKWSIIN